MRNLLKGHLYAATCAMAFFASSASAQTHSFNIAAQPAQTGARAFAQAAQTQVLITKDIAEGHTTNAVLGDYSIEQGFDILLKGTGLVAVSTGPSSYAIVDDTKPSASAQTEVTEVIVTAQKRNESAQKVPISMSVFSGKTMETYRLDDLRDISRMSPGLLVSAFNYSSPTIAIRGASNTFTQIGANKPVAVVLDDLFIPRNSAAVFDLYGMNSVQVLKGPQGTLFGRNVTGGAVVLDSGKPAFGAQSGSFRLGAGNYGLGQVDGLIDIPFGDQAAFRLAASIKSHSGYGFDRLSGLKEDDQHTRSARSQLRLMASDKVEVLLGLDYNDDHNGGRTLSSKAAGSDGNRRTSELNFPQDFHRNQWGASARVYWDAPIGKISSITGYRFSQSGEDYSGTGTNFTFLSGTATQAVNRDVDSVGLLSQELRYASPKWSFGDFVGGVYLAKEDAKRKLRTRTLKAVTGVPTTDVLTDQAVKTNSYGLYADGVINVSTQLFLTLGARYTYDQKTASLVRTDAINAANSFTGHDLKAHWGEVTPRVVLTWVPNQNLRFYSSMTRGYTAGGFNTDAATLAALSKPFDPEFVTNRELGVKSQWMGDRLRFNLSVFDMDYKDKQELFFNGVTRVLTITNAAKASIKGAESELSFSPIKGLNLTATYGRLNTRYDNFIIPGGAVLTGNPVASSPRHKGSLAADFRHTFADGFVTGALSWTTTEGYYTGATKDPNLHINAYSLTNLSLGYEPENRDWSLILWGKNIGNVAYVLTPSTQGVLAEYLGEPETYGLSFRRRF